MRTGGVGRGGTSCNPSKDFEKFGHKNSIKHEKEDPPRYSHNPMYPLKTFWERLCIYRLIFITCRKCVCTYMCVCGDTVCCYKQALSQNRVFLLNTKMLSYVRILSSVKAAIMWLIWERETDNINHKITIRLPFLKKGCWEIMGHLCQVRLG